MKTSEIKTEYVDHMSSDLNIVNAARVSFAKSVSEMREQDERLMNYLARHGHLSPFTHTSVSIRCKAPLFLARQLVKHQVGGTWSEESRRYISSEPEFYVPDTIHGRPDGSIKQGSGEAPTKLQCYIHSIEDHSKMSLELYNNMINRGVAPEEARMVLPLNTMTSWIWTGSLLFFTRVFNQRSDSHAQLAAQEFAHKLAEVVEPLFPVAWRVLTEKGGENEQ